MRIEGMDQFISRLAPHTSKTAEKNISNPYVIRRERDILDISDMGKRLRLNSGDITKLSEVTASTGGDSILQLMSKSMSEVEGILEKMKALAMVALDPNLSIVDRLNMQIDMEELKAKLSKSTNAMSEKFAKMSGVDMEKRKRHSFTDANVSGIGSEDMDERLLLERARDRAIKGEAWNVAEGYEIFMELTRVHINGPEMEAEKWIEVERGTWFELPSNIDLEKSVIMSNVEFVKSGWYVMDNKERLESKVPTVLEWLEASGTIILLDARSAAKGVERLEMQLDEMKQMREEFTRFCNENVPRSFGAGTKMSEGEIYAMIGKIAQEQEREREKLEADSLPTREYEEGADVNVGVAEEMDVQKKYEKESFHTQLGVMEFKDIISPRLTRPENRKGEMFARIERLFDKISEKFTAPIYECFHAIKTTLTNCDPSSWSKENVSGN